VFPIHLQCSKEKQAGNDCVSYALQSSVFSLLKSLAVVAENIATFFDIFELMPQDIN
jgi:hypothetical protein